MKIVVFRWSAEKNQQLRESRGVSFEDVEAAIEDGRVLADVPHPNQEDYPGQQVLIVEINNYAFNVPYVIDGEGLFFKTVFPSCKSTKYFLNRDAEHE